MSSPFLAGRKSLNTVGIVLTEVVWQRHLYHQLCGIGSNLYCQLIYPDQGEPSSGARPNRVASTLGTRGTVSLGKSFEAGCHSG